MIPLSLSFLMISFMLPGVMHWRFNRSVQHHRTAKSQPPTPRVGYSQVDLLYN
jgi:hypothetical protein